MTRIWTQIEEQTQINVNNIDVSLYKCLSARKHFRTGKKLCTVRDPESFMAFKKHAAGAVKYTREGKEITAKRDVLNEILANQNRARSIEEEMKAAKRGAGQELECSTFD